MSTISSSSSTSVVDLSAASARRRQSLFSAYMELTKARLSALVLVTTAVGFVMAWPVGMLPFDWALLGWTILGTALCAGAANTLNEVIEVRRDALMHRTCRRPLPDARVSLRHALVLALLLAYTGAAVLAIKVNLPAAALALLTIAIYVLAYTPLKTRSSLNTLVGAVCGAIPPIIGWVGAAGRIDTGAWVLASILFIWQLPHFLALAWLYRDDYRRGGFAMLSVIEPHGRLTGRVAVLSSLALIPVTLAATLVGMTGWLYAAGGLLLGVIMLALAAHLNDRKSQLSARRLFLASIVYLPLLLMLMMIDRGPIGMGANVDTSDRPHVQSSDVWTFGRLDVSTE